ncbi:hypothetical protein [Telmatospirillum sp.]|uniref:hypothetical protein n=1 Tax=Telmatospirillum sp. TaxID=2079197 RepID=UPI00284463BA|nr:hypothetical protein [Telmatospirillum sp.]MDR3439783.1 hypothetical protein [Telmatospirillum sp.]
MKFIAPCFVCVAALLLASCGTRSSATVSPATAAPSDIAAATDAAAPVAAPKAPDKVLVTENDITDRPYQSLGDIEVTVRKWTVFDADPTKDKVSEALRAKAAEMGADAVVLTRYGTVGVSMWSWGEMNGNGRAVVFQK